MFMRKYCNHVWLLKESPLGFKFLWYSEREASAPAAGMADKLRDLSQPIDVSLLDATITAFYDAGSKLERGMLPTRYYATCKIIQTWIYKIIQTCRCRLSTFSRILRT
jgi:hypothetical protein